MYCSRCGKSNDADAKFCTSCGGPLVQKTAQESQKTYTGKVESKPYGATRSGAAPSGTYKQENKRPAGDPEKSSVLGIIALICAFLFPIVGLVLGLIDYNTNDGYSKKIAKWAMIAAGVILVLRIVLSIVSAIMGAAISRMVVDYIINTMKMYM